MIELRTEDKYPFNMQVSERAIGGESRLVRFDNPAAPRERHQPARAVHETHGFQPPLGSRPW
jgi:hypothetical protein